MQSAIFDTLIRQRKHRYPTTKMHESQIRGGKDEGVESFCLGSLVD